MRDTKAAATEDGCRRTAKAVGSVAGPDVVPVGGCVPVPMPEAPPVPVDPEPEPVPEPELDPGPEEVADDVPEEVWLDDPGPPMGDAADVVVPGGLSVAEVPVVDDGLFSPGRVVSVVGVVPVLVEEPPPVPVDVVDDPAPVLVVAVVGVVVSVGTEGLLEAGGEDCSDVDGVGEGGCVVDEGEAGGEVLGGLEVVGRIKLVLPSVLGCPCGVV